MVILRPDQKIIADSIPQGARVLDIGCGHGELLAYLVAHKQVDGRGIELSQEGVNACVQKGLAVIQGDAQTDLVDYPDQAFDYVILSHTIQAMVNPKEILIDLLRVGKFCIVSFPNFGYWKIRLSLLLKGRMPVNKLIPYEWYNTPNIHFCTIRDFVKLCSHINGDIQGYYAVSHQRARRCHLQQWPSSNRWAEQAVFMLGRKS